MKRSAPRVFFLARYFTGGEEELELPDLIDGLERYRQLRESDQQGLLAKEEQPYLDPEFDTLPTSKEEDFIHECDHCHKVRVLVDCSQGGFLPLPS